MIDGEIIVIGESGDRLEFEVLQQRIHPAASRVNMLSEKTPARFVAFDLLALGDDDYTQRAVRANAAPRWSEALADAQAPIHLTPATARPRRSPSSGSSSSRAPGWTG